MSNFFFLPPVNAMGIGALEASIDRIQKLGFQKALVVTDKPLVSLGLVKGITDKLNAAGVETIVFDDVKPNPTVGNVEDGLAVLHKHECDMVIAIGGGSPIDAAKGIALVATNGKQIADYEGVDVSAKPQLPLVAINTTAGTGSELTRFSIITNTENHIKMAIVDSNVTPIMSVNDPELMRGMPPALTAATGMDALTHAIEALVSTAATPFTDGLAEKAIPMIFEYLPRAVRDGNDMDARVALMYAEALAGAAFNSASLGAVHALAHQAGGLLDMPHGQANAILLPHVVEYNAPSCIGKMRVLAKLLGAADMRLSDKDLTGAVVRKINQLSKEVKIPSGLAEFGVEEKHLPIMAGNALKDACIFTNPRKATQEELIEVLRNAM
ncbi:iron-containing alcohol dehydrogenase [Vibrio coralliirubri]|uniref:iron-containing alcohol dehydrogenase n=1 Tax=Vibrio coralliirubri TaxID=1516159 RepID=UPI00228341EE|nr:iron-containing alcohol dehydrogenase [Vibrio coralliirubri]MCY9861133.1 iron-containing alcohol dehydrogenase [Vibrio coralliirubri]